MTIEIVDFPMKHGDFPSFSLCLPEGISLHGASGSHRNFPQDSAPVDKAVFFIFCFFFYAVGDAKQSDHRCWVKNIHHFMAGWWFGT